MGIDKQTSDIGTSLRRGESAKDTDLIALRNLQAAQNDNTIRMSVTIINKSKTATTIDTAEMGYRFDTTNVECDIAPGAPPFYTVKDTIKFRNGQAGSVTVEPKTGPFAGYLIPAQGTIAYGCASGKVDIVFPVTIDVPGQGSTSLTIELPRYIYTQPAPPQTGVAARPPERLHLDLPEPDDNPYTSASMFGRLGYGVQNGRASIDQQIDS
jgi:hypothetical protein